LLILCLILSFFVCAQGLVPIHEIEGEKFAITPAGFFPLSCVTELLVIDAPVKISSERTSSCKWSKLAKRLRENGPFPADYDGWLAYTSFNYAAGTTLDAFTGYFTVPSTPAVAPQVLYVFTGLQNVDWVPIVDPIPKVFDIIQPVLQYPGDNGNYWSVKSWYVTLEGAQVTAEVPLSVGDSIFGNMTRTGVDSWYIGGTSTQTGKTAGLKSQHNVLKNQPWAYCTVECYGCSGCPTEPTQSIEFTKLVLLADGSPVTPQWEAFQSPNPICNTTAHINAPDSVTFTFGS